MPDYFSETLKKFNAGVLVTLAFVIPFGGIASSILILLLALSWMIELIRFRNMNFRNLLSPVAITLILFYAMHLVGVMYSANSGKAVFDLQVKVSILFLPLFFYTSSHIQTSISRKIVLSFILGCIAASVVCLIHSYLNYTEEVQNKINIYSWALIGTNYFFSSRFSIFIHPSYFALYVCLALSGVYSLINHNSIRSVSFGLLIIFFLSLVVVLLASRAGLICLVLLILILIIHFNFRIRKPVVSLLFLGLLCGSFGVVYLKTPEFRQKMKNLNQSVLRNHSSSGKSEARRYIWKEAAILGSEHFLTGVGTGDVKDELARKFLSSGHPELSEKKFNAHNQFLQSFVALGMFGISFLTLFFIQSLLKAVRKQDILFMSFILLTGINFLFESMLETQSGVIFFAFFASVLSYPGYSSNLISGKFPSSPIKSEN